MRRGEGGCRKRPMKRGRRKRRECRDRAMKRRSKLRRGGEKEEEDGV